jgi:predicted MFS family arabinose efflux permease
MQGIGGTLLGATVVHLERLFDTDMATIGLVFPVTAIGGLIGSVICGVAYDRIVKYRELAFSLINFLSSVTIIIAPFVGDLGGLPAFVAMVFIWMIPRGYYFTSKWTKSFPIILLPYTS